MKYLKFAACILAAFLFAALAVLLGFRIYLSGQDGGFAREIPEKEQQIRLQIVESAIEWLGTHEGSAPHAQIIQIYNSHEPLAQEYEVKLEDNWCAAFASMVAINCSLTDIIPTECGCERQIGLWQNLGRWCEDDGYMPLPGDYIYYAWDEGWDFGDCTGWADHVGIVVGTAGPFIKVIEGNKEDSVAYRIIFRGNYQIRGFGLPDYRSKTE